MEAPIACLVLLYVCVELLRFVRLSRFQHHLRGHRTPLSHGFDRQQWAASMLAALRREASLGKPFLTNFIYTMSHEVIFSIFLDEHSRTVALILVFLIYVLLIQQALGGFQKEFNSLFLL